MTKTKLRDQAMPHYGILLINLGTPDDNTPASVYRYLKHFLNDPRVIDLPKLVRSVLINGLIIPKRYKKSAAAYQAIWTEQGSPLLLNSLALTKALSLTLGNDFHVELGMRYGKPSIASALDKLSHCDKIAIIPLFPQYASAANGSAIEECLRILGSQWNVPDIHIQKDFYQNPDFIAAYADVIQKSLNTKPVDQILFSYHGLPERHITKSACTAPCDKTNACPSMNTNNTYCYRAQCYETTRLIAEKLQLQPTQYQVSFQSRLGRTPWIKPYTDLVLPDLYQQNHRNIAVVCPSFVSDCLETLEEIDIRAREQWKQLGGNEFTFIPCINDHPRWVLGLANMCKNLFAL